MSAPAGPKLSITPALVAEHGFKGDEYERLLGILGREPTLLELGIFSVMWSEHCSYKSSRFWLKQLPTSGPRVIQGPGENAGVIDIGDGDAIIFKMESHNHPSFIEPYQGAATGVGGIMRDVFTMGARPIANLNALRFGDPSHAKTRRLVAGVVAGIGGYGNSVGVPTVGGETDFDAARRALASEERRLGDDSGHTRETEAIEQQERSDIAPDVGRMAARVKPCCGRSPGSASRSPSDNCDIRHRTRQPGRAPHS